MKDQNRVRNSIENVSFSSHEPNMQPQNATELIGRIDNVFYLKMTDTDTSSRPWFPSKSFFLREHASDVDQKSDVFSALPRTPGETGMNGKNVVFFPSKIHVFSGLLINPWYIFCCFDGGPGGRRKGEDF